MKKVKSFLQRKTLIYKTNVEYGDYTINHIQGCSHGCKYPCYAYLMKKRFGNIKSYEEWIKPVIVENTLELLDKEIPKFRKQRYTACCQDHHIGAFFYHQYWGDLYTQFVLHTIFFAHCNIIFNCS